MLKGVMKDRISASITLNDLYLISKWAYSWKMSFNTDPSKQATEIVFSKKRSDIQLPTLRFNNNSLTLPRLGFLLSISPPPPPPPIVNSLIFNHLTLNLPQYFFDLSMIRIRRKKIKMAEIFNDVMAEECCDVMTGGNMKKNLILYNI